MKTNFIKKIFLGGIFLTLLLFSSQNLVKRAKATSNANIRYITTSVGEKETSVGINYHCDIQNSSVIYSTSKAFKNAITVEAVSKEWHFDQVDDDTQSGFSSRYVCTVNLDNLEENTTYYYQVVAGDEKSELHSFKTASANNTSSKILFASDIHAAAGYDTTDKSNGNIESVLNANNDINLVVMTGDQIDRGGYENYWQAFFNGEKALENVIQAAIPGNHEYYHSKNASYISPEIFNQFYNNPKNAVEGRLNSSYYFKYGNALIIMLDTIKMSNDKYGSNYLSEQKEWFRKVVKENPAQWIIVGSHAGCISAGSYASDAKWMSNNWGPVFEECQVDLAISGHEHVYIRRNSIVNGSFDEINGITYLVSPAAGHKAYTGVQKDGYIVKNINYACNTIKITEDKLTVDFYAYDTNSKTSKMLNDYSFTLEPKRPNGEIEKITEEEITNSLTMNINKKEQLITFNWDKRYYGNVESISIDKIVNGAIEDTYEIKINNLRAKSYKFTPIFDTYNYDFDVSIKLKDGKILSKHFDYDNVQVYKFIVEYNGGRLEGNKKLDVYYDHSFVTLPKPVKDNSEFVGWYDNPNFYGDPIVSISSASSDIMLYAKWIDHYNITYILNGGALPADAETSYIGGEKLTLPIPSNGKLEFLGWYLEEDFSGNKVSTIKSSQTGDITLYAKWSKKGCNKSNAFIEMLSLLAITIFCFRKKH